MAKQFNMTVRLKNITDFTVAVAGTVVSPKASVPVKAKKAAHIRSILLNHQQGKVEILNLEAIALAALIGFELEPDESVTEPESDVVETPVDEHGSEDQKKGDDSSDKQGASGLNVDGEPQGDEKTPPDSDDKESDKTDESVEPKVEDKKPAAKKQSAKKPAPKKEEPEQPNLLNENE